MTPESLVKKRVSAVLKAAGAYYHMPVQNGMGSPTLDYIGCHAGRFYSIETKAGSAGPTKRQALTMAAMAAAGAKVFLINDATGEDELKQWLGVYE